MRRSRLWRVLGCSALLLFLLGGPIWAGADGPESRSGDSAALVAGRFRAPARSLVPPTSAAPAESSAWHSVEVDPARRFQDMGDHSLALDAAGHPHIAYGQDHLYYSYYDGTAWHRETVDGAPSVGREASLALDAAGRPHIAYCDDGNAAIKYAHYDGATWQIETVASHCVKPSLVLDSSDRPHLVYFDSALPGWMKYAYSDGTSWHIQVIGRRMGDPSLALDTSDQPRISYRISAGGLGYAYYHDNTWISETVELGPASFGAGSSLALDADDRPHISYGKWYAHFDGTTWLTETIPGVFGCSSTSLGLDSAGRPHIACGGGSYFPSKYAYLDGGAWQVETVYDRGGDFISLALDPTGRPHLSFRVDTGEGAYGGAPYALQYARRDAGWQVETVDQGGGSVGYYNSLALDAAGRPHISYWDWGNETLKYASYDGTAWISETVHNDEPVFGSPTSLALDAAGRPHIAYCTARYDIDCEQLRYAWNDGSGWLTTTVDSGSGVGRDASLALDKSGRPHIAYGGYADLRYAYFDGASWISMTVEPAAGEFWPGQASLVLDAADRPHIAYWSDFELRYAYDDGAGWQFQTAAPMGEGNGISLALDAAGRPRIVFQAGTPPGGQWLFYAYDDGLGWSTETILPQEASWGSLALDAAGGPHVALYAGGLVYASREGSTWITETVASNGGPDTSLVLDGQDRPHVSYTDYYGAPGLGYAWWQCDPLAGVTLSGPERLPVGIAGFYSASYTPFTATVPDLAWSNGGVGLTGAYSWTTVGDYRLAVTATNPCSQAGDSFTVTVFCQPLEGVVITGPVSLVAGQEGSYQAVVEPITASWPLTWTWDTGVMSSSAGYSWIVPGTYTVTVTGSNACGQAEGSLSVAVLPCLPVFTVTIAGPPVLRVGEAGLYTVTFLPPTATQPLVWNWDNGVIGSSAVYSWTTPGMYEVTVTATNICGDARSGSREVWVGMYYLYLPLARKN